MAIYDLVIDNVVMPNVGELDINFSSVGGSVSLANGAIRRDIVREDLVATVTIVWPKVTGQELNTIKEAFDKLLRYEKAVVLPGGEEKIMTAAEGNGAISCRMYRSGSRLLYNVTMTMREA